MMVPTAGRSPNPVYIDGASVTDINGTVQYGWNVWYDSYGIITFALRVLEDLMLIMLGMLINLVIFHFSQIMELPTALRPRYQFLLV